MQPSIPPGRKRFYKWIFRSMLGVVVAAGISFAIVLPRIFSAPLPVVDYKEKERELIESRLPRDARESDENALQSIADAGDLIRLAEVELGENQDSPYFVGKFIDFTSLPSGEDIDTGNFLDEDELEMVIARLHDRGIDELLDRAANTPRSVLVRDPNELIIKDNQIVLGDSRLAGSYANYVGWRSACQGEWAQALRALGWMIGLERALSQQSSLVFQLIGHSHGAIRLDAMRSWIDLASLEHPVPLDEFLRVLRESPDLQPLSFSIESERLQFLEIYQSWYTNQPVANPDGKPDMPNWMLRAVLTHKEAATAVDSFMDEVAAWIDLERLEREQGFAEIEAAAQRLPKGVALHAVTDSYRRAARNRDGLITDTRLTQLLLAVELHRARRGSLPDSLDQLVPGILEEVPADLFDPEGGFRYRVTDDGADYLLYSIGFDGQDDGGATATEADHQALMGDCSGCDYVIHGGPSSDDEAESEP